MLSSLINVNKGVEFSPSVHEIVGIHVPARNLRNFSTFICSTKHSSSHECASDAKAVCKLIDIVTCIPIARQRLGEHIPAGPTREK
jgi:hypothetical protein